jgi:hypothetical protein
MAGEAGFWVERSSPLGLSRPDARRSGCRPQVKRAVPTLRGSDADGSVGPSASRTSWVGSAPHAIAPGRFRAPARPPVSDALSVELRAPKLVGDLDVLVAIECD